MLNRYSLFTLLKGNSGGIRSIEYLILENEVDR